MDRIGPRSIKPRTKARVVSRVLFTARRPKPTTKQPVTRADCVYLGDVLSSKNAAGVNVSCAEKWLRECDRLGECRIDEHWKTEDGHDGPRCFRDGKPLCGDYCSRSQPAPDLRGPVPSEFLARFDETTLCSGIPGKRFNPSIEHHGDGYAFAFRNGWAGSEIYVLRMDQQLQPAGPPVRLPMSRPRQSHFGREDPRLFRHHGKLHVMFTGVVGRNGPTNVLFARLSDDFAVEDLFYPRVPGRTSWEKNHVYFEVAGDLFAIYAIEDHRIMRVRSDHVEFVYRSATPKPWIGGQPRGGASPVRVGDEFWHFFHSRRERDGHRIYEMGLYTFEVQPPFRPLRIIPEPLMIANPSTKPLDQYASVVWPGGAMYTDDRWIIALGVHDRWSELHAFNHIDLESRLIPCS